MNRVPAVAIRRAKECQPAGNLDKMLQACLVDYSAMFTELLKAEGFTSPVHAERCDEHLRGASVGPFSELLQRLLK
jgi:hypothetical protein